MSDGNKIGDQAARILVIDDDPSLLRSVRLTLLVEGFDVGTATNGVEGLEALEAQSFDLVVLDLQMPRMDGRTFFREIRSRGHDVPVLILSAYGADSARAELNAEAAVDKPFDPDYLIAEVKRLLDGRSPGS